MTTGVVLGAVAVLAVAPQAVSPITSAVVNNCPGAILPTRLRINAFLLLHIRTHPTDLTFQRRFPTVTG
ncbi:MAG: hypothetical protein ACYDGR_00195 [Candidatus Dormibacteria bacterium]